MAQKHVTFGIMLQGPGGHMNAWKHPSVPADASTNLNFFVKTARKAEEAGIAFAFVADSVRGLDLPGDLDGNLASSPQCS